MYDISFFFFFLFWGEGGFASYLLALNKKTYEMSGVNNEGNSIKGVKEPGFGWMTGYLFLVCFVGLFALVPLRKVLVSLIFFLEKLQSVLFTFFPTLGVLVTF